MLKQQLTMQLQAMAGELAAALAAVDTDCLRSRFTEPVERLERTTRLMKLVPDRATALALSDAFGRTRWPAAYGESPYDHVMCVIRCALQGVALLEGSTAAQRALHAMCVEAFALPCARARLNLDDAGRRRRYPRLLRAMEHAALLTTGEADSALRGLLRTHPLGRGHAPASCEAVAHFGGNLKVVRAARRWRQRFASTARVALATVAA